MYRQALSIAYDHSLNFVTPVLWGQPFTTSKYGLGLSLLYLPGLAFGFWLKPFVPSAGGLAYDWALFYRDPLYMVACAPVHVVIVACTGYLVARFIRGLGFDRGVALWGLALWCRLSGDRLRARRLGSARALLDRRAPCRDALPELRAGAPSRPAPRGNLWRADAAPGGS